MTYRERYDRLLFSVAILSGGLCAMGLIDAVTNVFTVLGTGLYVFYRKFVIRFEIASSLNFKEKTEYLAGILEVVFLFLWEKVQILLPWN